MKREKLEATPANGKLQFMIAGRKSIFELLAFAENGGSKTYCCYMKDFSETRIGNIEFTATGMRWYTFHPLHAKMITGIIKYKDILPVEISKPVQGLTT